MKGRSLPLGIALTLLLATPALADKGCEGDWTDGASKLTVQVSGATPVVGEVAITVYPDDKGRFLAPKGKLARVRVPAASPTLACFWVPMGTYEVAVYHDANGDHAFNRTLAGLPAEGFGFSNDPETRTGLPPFASVRFAVPKGEKMINIRMKYVH